MRATGTLYEQINVRRQVNRKALSWKVKASSNMPQNPDLIQVIDI